MLVLAGDHGWPCSKPFPKGLTLPHGAVWMLLRCALITPHFPQMLPIVKVVSLVLIKRMTLIRYTLELLSYPNASTLKHYKLSSRATIPSAYIVPSASILNHKLFPGILSNFIDKDRTSIILPRLGDCTYLILCLYGLDLHLASSYFSNTDPSMWCSLHSFMFETYN